METLWFKSGIQGVASPGISLAGSFDGRPTALCQVSAVGRSSVDKSKVVAPPQKTAPSPSSSRFSFRYPLKSLWFGSNSGGDNGHGGISLGDDTALVEDRERSDSDSANSRIEDMFENPVVSEGQHDNWVLKILHLQPGNEDEDVKGRGGEQLEKGLASDLDGECSSAVGIGEENSDAVGEEEEELCDACRVEFDGEDDVEIDRKTFSRFLHGVSLNQAKLYAKMAYLGNLAYAISDIRPAKLLKTRGLRLITSSLEKKKLATKAVEEEQASSEHEEPMKDAAKDPENKGGGYQINPSIVYQVAASAASYLHSHMKDILSVKPSKEEEGQELPDDGIDNVVNTTNSDMASFMKATDSVTSVVAAEEEVKQALADDLNSIYSSPCEWFICDDDDSSTRVFVIQGSESLPSWQANLLFEPIEFEGFDILVHRGIYEAAKGIYEQMLPEVRAHLETHGNHATFRFTGHSLGGSLSLLINLMLLIRGELPLSSLLPVITFGAPAIMCGGDRLLRELGLPRSHVQAVTMHRDIVPRAFSCTYPNHVGELLKAINGNFRNHPCLNNEKLLYAHMGELLILQPDEKFSPHHDLLPSGSGLYLLSCLITDVADAQKQLRAAQKLFFNSPHPLEILSDCSAYGTGGTVRREHDIYSYLKCVQTVIRQELHRTRKAKRDRRRTLWWPLIALVGDINDGIIFDRTVQQVNLHQYQLNFSGILENSQESLKRFSRLVADQRMHLFMVLLFPARLLLLGTNSAIRFH